jgi:hypothetical protein
MVESAKQTYTVSAEANYNGRLINLDRKEGLNNGSEQQKETAPEDYS